MSTGTTFALPTQALPDTPASNKTFGVSDVQTNQVSAPAQSYHEMDSPSRLPAPQTATLSLQLQSTAHHDSDANLTVPQSGDAEDEYTLSAYGDISLSEIVVPPLPAPTHTGSSPLQPRVPQPCLRLKVQRPPMPKRRPYYYDSDPMSHSGGLDTDKHWPESPRPPANISSQESPWAQHQPLVSPLPVSSWTQGDKLAKKSEKCLDRPSPGQETREKKSGVYQGRNPPEADDVVKSPRSALMPAPRQDRPKPPSWRTRLPPRLPIPKWDI